MQLKILKNEKDFVHDYWKWRRSIAVRREVFPLMRRGISNGWFLEKREKERVDREQRRDDDIKRRSQAQLEENMQRMKVFEESAKSFGTKLETQVDRMRDQALKDKQAYIEKERKAYETSLI